MAMFVCLEILEQTHGKELTYRDGVFPLPEVEGIIHIQGPGLVLGG